MMKKAIITANIAVLCVLLCMSFVSCKSESGERDAPTAAASSTKDEFEVYEFNDMNIAIPWDIVDQVIIEEGQVLDDWDVVVRVFEKASVEAGKQDGFKDGVGHLFSIIRCDRSQYETMLIENRGVAGELVFFAKNGDEYYAWSTSTDIQLYRTDGNLTEQDFKIWETLSAMDSVVQSEFIARNGLQSIEEDPVWLAQPLAFDGVVAIPNFLSKEQQLIYRKADFLYCHMFGGETSGIDTIATDDTSVAHEPDTIERNGMIYTKSHGKYHCWDDFEEAVHSVFTDNFWKETNCVSEDAPIYMEHEGSLYYIDASRGSGYYYNENYENKFELVSKTDEEISFNLIGHYSEIWKKENETSEQRELRLKSGYDYTIEFPMKLVLTEDGWRFEEFHSALADELPPDISKASLED